MNFLAHHDKVIMMGDFNSLSKEDAYFVQNFNVTQIKKFTKGGKLRTDVIEKISAAGFYDSAVVLDKNHQYTVPTPISKDPAHAQMRLDYIFLSQSLLPHLAEYHVVKNEISEKASDHYPVVVTLNY